MIIESNLEFQDKKIYKFPRINNKFDSEIKIFEL